MLNLCNQLITFSPSLQTESPIRIVALGHSMANARDVADWLGAPPHAAFGFAPGEAAGLVCGCVGQRWGGGVRDQARVVRVLLQGLLQVV